MDDTLTAGIDDNDPRYITMDDKEIQYSIELHYDDRDYIYVATIPELEGCMAHGETPEEAVREIQVACELWLETARSSGIPIPKPRLQAKYA